jgi:hypothetical protein
MDQSEKLGDMRKINKSESGGRVSQLPLSLAKIEIIKYLDF